MRLLPVRRSDQLVKAIQLVKAMVTPEKVELPLGQTPNE